MEKFELEPDKIQMLSPANLHLKIAEKQIDIGFASFTTMAIAYREAVAYVKTHPEIWAEYEERIEMEDPKEIAILRERMTASLGSEWDAAQIELQRAYLETAGGVLGESILPAAPPGLIRDDFNP